MFDGVGSMSISPERKPTAWARLEMGITSTFWTTAASACAVIDLVARGGLRDRGFLKQEDVPFDAFLATATGSLFVDEAPDR